MNNQEYKTKDLAEATALVSTGNNLLRIDRDGRICFFVFENRHDCEIISNKFFFGKLLVNGREFYEAMIRLKSRIFQ